MLLCSMSNGNIDWHNIQPSKETLQKILFPTLVLGLYVEKLYYNKLAANATTVTPISVEENSKG